MNLQLSQFLLNLYRAARGSEPGELKSNALEQFRSLVYFDSAIWLEGHHNGDRFEATSVYLHDQSEEMISHYAGFSQQDRMLCALPARLGRAVTLNDMWTRKDYEASAFYRGFAAGYGIEEIMCIELSRQDSSQNSLISLYRTQKGTPFQGIEREVMQYLAPHLVEAHELSTFTHLMGPGAAFRHADIRVVDTGSRDDPRVMDAVYGSLPPAVNNGVE